MNELLARVSAAAAVIGLFLMMALTFADVIWRYFLNAPIAGATEYISFLLAIVLYAGLPVVTRQDSHIKVGVLVTRLPAILQKAENIISPAVTLGMTALVAYITFRQAEILRESGALTPYLDMPVSPVVYAAGIFSLIAALFAACHWYAGIFKARTRPDNEPPQ